MRKMLGVLIALQEEIRQSGRIDDDSINQVYTEMGISGGVAASNELIANLCRMLANDSNAAQNSSESQTSTLDLERYG